jgi:transmembrane sensor
MSKINAEDLLLKYNAGTATEEEKAWVETWYARFEDKVQVVSPDQVVLDKSESWKILAQAYNRSRPVQRLWPRIAIAASMLITIGVGFYFYSVNIHLKIVKAQYAHTLQPEKNKAILTLANGKRISLTEAKNGELAEQSGTKITKTEDGQLVYSASVNSGTSESLNYNTIQIPKGQQYQINLPDGTKVWLNAASTLRYPTRFAGSERRVELSGEAYFEVAKNKAMPFHVNSGKQDVEVLGTHFNVNSYTDEKVVETTLLEGSVKVTDQFSHSAQVISPGQQASLLPNHSITVKEANVSKAVAWKNGDFSFRNDDLPYIMRQISRWYDIEVVYQGNIPPSKFAGQASRKITLSQMMDIIRASGVQVTLKDRTLFIKGSE